MTISRDIKLPASYEVAHKRLTAAFAVPIVAQKGSLVLAKIVFEGRIEGPTVEIQYREYGRSIKYYVATGQLVNDPAGSRLQLTIDDDFTISPFIRFLPLVVWLVIWSGTQFAPDLIPVGVLALLMAVLAPSITAWHLRTAATRIEKTILHLVTNTR